MRFLKNFVVAPKAHTVEDVPLAHMTNIKPQGEHLEPKVHLEDGKIIIRGSEYLTQVVVPPAIGGTTTTVPQGGCFFSCPLNPLDNDGLRVSRQLALYDQFRIKHLAIEYVPMCPMTQAGGFVGVVTNDPSYNITTVGGQLSLRDALSRPGAELCSLTAPSSTRENTQLMKWYFTDTALGAFEEVPGIFWLLSSIDQSNATTSAIPLGILWMHYEFEVRSDSFEAPPALQFTPSGGFSASFTNVAETIVDTVRIPLANLPLPSAMADPGVVFSFIVVSCDDTVGNSLWRTWTDRAIGKNVLISPGMLIYGRCDDSGTTWTFYPSLAAAMTGQVAGADGVDQLVSYAWSRTAAANPASHGLKIYGVAGFDVYPDV